MRVKVTLRCNECKQRNYNTMKNKKIGRASCRERVYVLV